MPHSVDLVTAGDLRPRAGASGRIPAKPGVRPGRLCHARPMDDKTILRRISELVAEEHRLRADAQTDQVGTDDDTRARLRALEECLDQCWDLLRRRRAARDNSGDPESQGTRGASEVERYLQ